MGFFFEGVMYGTPGVGRDLVLVAVEVLMHEDLFHFIVRVGVEPAVVGRDLTDGPVDREVPVLPVQRGRVCVFDLARVARVADDQMEREREAKIPGELGRLFFGDLLQGRVDFDDVCPRAGRKRREQHDRQRQHAGRRQAAT